MKKIVSITIVVLLVGLIFWKLAANKKEIDSKKEVKTTTTSVAVTVKAAEMLLVTNEMNFVGVTDANQKVSITPETNGKILEINFKEGDFVTKGKTLAKIDEKLNQLSLDNAKLAYVRYKHDYEKFKILRQSDAVSENQLLDMKLAYENAEIQVEQAQKMLENTRITAPFTGYITKKHIDLGAFVSTMPATPIADIVDVSQLKISFSVSESNAYALKLGQEVNIKSSIYPDVVFKGKVQFISAQGDNAHTYPVLVAMENQQKYQLKAGTYVKITVPSTETVTRLAIPRDAIISSIKEPTVYLLDGDKAKSVKITSGREFGENIEVLEGLKVGDKVITNGQINLSDGASVIIRN